MRFLFVMWLGAILLGCATSSSYKVIDVIDLPPPSQVQAERRGDQITIRWRPGLERRHPQFSGYKLFIAKCSLATTPVQELPKPIAVSNFDTTFSFTSTDTAKLFLHVRSCLGKQRISLPSLPEVSVPGRTIR